MKPVHDGARPAKKEPRPPKIYTNSRINMLRTLERLTRFSLKADTTQEQLVKLKTAARFLGLRIDMEKLFLESDRLDLAERRFALDVETGQKLDQVLDLLQGEKGKK